MSEIHIDTTKIKECGTDVVSLSSELYEIIDTMFRRINNVNKVTGEWVGSSADIFINKANVDKLQYLTMQNQIYQYGKWLIDYANKMEDVVKEVQR